MTYLGILEVLESAARTVDSSATYYRGRSADISLASHTAEQNLIYVLDTMRGNPDTDNRMELWTIRVGFLRQDSTSSESMEANQVQVNEESRETIFSETLILARAFYSALYNEDEVQLSGQPSINQITRDLQGTFTGWLLEFQVLLSVGCDDVEIADAIYTNGSSPEFQVSIKRGETYEADPITVTDSDGSTYEQAANTDVVCTPSASPATAVLKNTDGDTISSTSIDPGTSEDIEAPDGNYTLKDEDGLTLSTGSIPSDTSEDITAPNAIANLRNSANTLISINNLRSGTTYNVIAPDATAVVKDQHGNTLDTEAIPSNVSEDIIITLPQLATIYFAFDSGDDTSALFTNPDTTLTLTALAQDGASGTITVSVNGGSYAAFVNPTTVTNGQTLQVKRTSTGSAGSVTITGTYA